MPSLQPGLVAAVILLLLIRVGVTRKSEPFQPNEGKNARNFKNLPPNNFKFTSQFSDVGNLTAPHGRFAGLHTGDENGENNNHTAPNGKILGRRFGMESFHDFLPSKYPTELDNYWIINPSSTSNFSTRNNVLRKLDFGQSFQNWKLPSSSKKNEKTRKNRKYSDDFDDYLGTESKHHHELSDRKYIHEHEGFFFPIHYPHHEKEDNLIPLLLLLLLPLLLFAIIIPLNANLLSTLFLIMQTNGATATAQLAANGRRKKRQLPQLSHPILEDRILEMLQVISKVFETFEQSGTF